MPLNRVVNRVLSLKMSISSFGVVNRVSFFDRNPLKECEGWLQKATFVMLRVFEENIVKINKTNS